MDYVNPPTILSTVQVVVPSNVPSARLLASNQQGARRATVIVNRGGVVAYIGSSPQVDSVTGFALYPGESVIMAVQAEVFGTPGTYHMLTLSK